MYTMIVSDWDDDDLVPAINEFFVKGAANQILYNYLTIF